MDAEQKSYLRLARENAGYSSAADFASAHKITESTYRSHENGVRGLPIAAAKRYAPLLGVSWQYLIDGEGELPQPSAAQHERVSEKVTLPSINIQHMNRDVPILGAAACGEDGLFELNGQVHDHARRPPRLEGVKDAYAVYVCGDSMSPWREPGQLVYVHPHQPVKVGDYVVVQLAESANAPVHAYVKKLVRRTAEKLWLQQFNPREEISLPAKKVKSIHRIIDWSELMGI